MLIESPSIIMPFIGLPYLRKRMISSAPKILNMVQADTIKCETTFNFIPFIDSPTNSMCLRLSSNENFPSNKNSAMVASTGYLRNGHILHPRIKVTNVIAYGGGSPGPNALTSHVLVASTEKDATDYTVGEDGMVVSSRNEVDRVGKINWLRDLFNSLAAQSSFIVASKRVRLAIACQDYGMQGSTSDFKDLSAEDRIGNNFGLSFSLLILRLNLKCLDFSEANRTL